MASTEQQGHAASLKPSADMVGRAFIQQYYHILHKSPELVYRFYQENSIVGRPDESGTMTFASSMLGINEKLTTFDYGNAIADVATVDSQDSYNGGVFVVVTGYLNGTDNSRLKFTQSFFLAPQDTGYYVFNDVFRYLDDGGDQYGEQTLVNGAEDPHSPEHDSSTVKESNVSETEVAMSSDVGAKEVYNPGKEEVSIEEEEEEEEAPAVPEVAAEIPENSKPVESIPKIEATPKRSYASILSSHHNVKAVKVIALPPLSAPARAPAKTTQQNQEPVLAAPTPTPTPVPVPETVTSGTDVNENGTNKEVEDGYSIYIRGLPWDTTLALVETEFKKFGPIKANGIQVRFQKGFCFGFVEFEVASAAQSALEASPIHINGYQVFVEEKRSTFRGGRGRFLGARINSGFRSEGARGRGFGGGRGYGRGGEYFGGRNGNRGGYQRVGVNRAGVLGPVDASMKTASLRVPATA